ncbi:MAG TPA: hypothetical protein VGM20_03395 [Gemmatimonadales bacterium]|jgi:hypothetical protein
MMRWLASLAAVSLLLAGCGAHDDPTQRHLPPSTRGPTVTVVDSITIAEPDSLPLGEYASYIARSGRGDLFVADAGLRKVLHFDAGGRFRGVLGRAGDGPGELRTPASIGLLPGDSLLAVTDVNRARIVVFGADDAVLRREIGTPPMQFVSQEWSRRDDTVVFGFTAARAALGKWAWHGDSIVPSGRTPRRAQLAGIAYGESSIVATDSGYVALFPTEPGLFVLNRDAVPTGFVRIPVARRRGEPGDLMDKRKKLAAKQPGALAGSMALGVQRLASGEWLVISGDVDVSRSGEQTRGVNMRYYVSVVSANMQKVCVDGKFPLTTDVLSRPILSADTVLLLTRNVESAGTRNRLLSMVVSTAGCDWQPTGGVEPPPRDSL